MSERCAFTRRTGTAANARCARTATRNGLCAKHQPDRAARRKPIALKFLKTTFALATDAELAAVRELLTSEEVSRASQICCDHGIPLTAACNISPCSSPPSTHRREK